MLKADRALRVFLQEVTETDISRLTEDHLMSLAPAARTLEVASEFAYNIREWKAEAHYSAQMRSTAMDLLKGKQKSTSSRAADSYRTAKRQSSALNLNYDPTKRGDHPKARCSIHPNGTHSNENYRQRNKSAVVLTLWRDDVSDSLSLEEQSHQARMEVDMLRQQFTTAAVSAPMAQDLSLKPRASQLGRGVTELEMA